MPASQADRIAGILLKYRVLFSLVTLALVMLASTGISRLQFSSSVLEYIRDDDPRKQAYYAISDNFLPLERLIYVLDFGDEGTFTPQHLKLLEALSESANDEPQAVKTVSLTNTFYSFVDGDTMTVKPLFDDVSQATQGDIQRRMALVQNDPLIIDRLVAGDGRVAVVVSYIGWSSQYHIDELLGLVESAKTRRQQLLQHYPEASILLSGEVMVEYALFEAAVRDITLLFPVVIAFGLVILWLLVRSVPIILATVAVLLVALVCLLGLAGYSGVTLSQSSALVPIIVFIIAIAQLMHVLVGYIQGMNKGLNKDQALHRSLADNIGPLTLSCVTTIIGFLCLNSCDSPVFVDLGNLSALGIACSFVISLGILPLALLSLPRHSAPLPPRLDQLMLRLATFVMSGRWRILLPALLCLLVTALMVPLNKLDNDMLKYFSPQHPLRQATSFTVEHLIERQQLVFTIDTQHDNGVNDIDFLGRLSAFDRWLMQQAQVSKVFSYESLLRRLNQSMHGDKPDWYRLPETTAQASQLLLAYELSLPDPDALNELLNSERSGVRISVVTHYLDNQQMLAFEQHCLEWLNQSFGDGNDIRVSSQDLLFAHLGQNVIASMINGSILSLVVITLVISVGLRSWRYGLLSIVPNVMPSVIVYGLWGLFVGEVNMAVAVTFSVSFGIIVDDTVHILSHYQRYLAAGLSSRAAIEKTFRTTGVALLSTTVALVGGLLIIAQSDYGVHATMGWIVAGVISIALVLDFLLLPVLLTFKQQKASPVSL